MPASWARSEKEKLGYSKPAIARPGPARAKDWAKGGAPKDLPAGRPKPPPKTPRDVFLFVISGAKAKNPAAAQALIAAL